MKFPRLKNPVLGLAASLALAAATASAQTPIGGVVSGTLSAGVYHTTGTLTVASATTLTLAPGVIIKFTSPTDSVNLAGTLIVNGTPVNPVIFTDDADDSAGGDTNLNGPSVGAAAAWEGITFSSGSSASVLNYADIRYGGSGFVANLHVNGTSPTFTNCTIRDCFTHGMNLLHTGTPTVTNCTFINNGGRAIESAPIAALANFSNNSASGNAGNLGNFARVSAAIVSSNLTISAASNISGATVFDTSINIAAGATLSLNAGVTFKFKLGFSLTVNGTLNITGAAGNPVILTDDADDSAGGDTNGDGSSAGVAGSWQGVKFNAGSNASVVNYADIRYGGWGSVANAHLNSASPTLTNCTMRNGSADGMNLNTSARPVVTNCAFLDNGGDAVALAEIEAVAGFTNNIASGNIGNFIRVTNAIVTTPVTIAAQSCMNGAIVLSTSVTVQTAGVLTILQGSVLKFTTGFVMTVNGAAHFRGTTYEPVVLTAFADDDHGGDTNGNGPSAGVSGSWQGITFGAGATTSAVENALLRYTGWGSATGLTSTSGSVTLSSVRVDDSQSVGFALAAVASATNLVAWSCGSHGIQVTGGSFDVVHATCASNSTGIRREAAWTGVVRNSISYGNGTNFSNFGAGAQVTYSNGAFAGTNNNINVDPLFVDAPAGDLALQATSPCIDAAEAFVAFAATRDHAENSRILDSELLGIPGADMGAFEHAVWDMTVAGTTRIGTDVTFTITGPAGDCTYLLGILDGTIPYSPFGILLSGAIPYVTVIPLNPVVIPVGTPVTIAVPFDPSIVGLVAGIQTLTTPPGDPTVGNFTRLHRALVRP